MWLSLVVNAYFVSIGAKYILSRMFGNSQTLKDAAIAILVLFPAVPLGPIAMAVAYINAPQGYQWIAVGWTLVAVVAANAIHLHYLGKEGKISN